MGVYAREKAAVFEAALNVTLHELKNSRNKLLGSLRSSTEQSADWSFAVQEIAACASPSWPLCCLHLSQE